MPNSESDNSIPVSPSLDAEVGVEARPDAGVLGTRTIAITLVAVLIGLIATLTAKALVLLIAFVTNLAFFGKVSLAPADPATNAIGPLVLVVPVLGGIVVGFMARYGSRAIRGHGIPEAMEQVLTNQSRVPPRLTFLKPVSSAIAIGTGGPFGAEGPIIATGGALGSLIGQLLRTTAMERKILLSAGAAAGMTAIFGSPIAAVILAIELLLFELRAGSLIPVAMACAAAAGLRIVFFEPGPVFAMPALHAPGGPAIAFYVCLGLVIGLASVVVTRLVYWVEDAFEKIPVHWMIYPAVGGLAVGIVGYFEPRTLGVGYSNITNILDGKVVGMAVVSLALLKFVSWVVALGSGTSGGTLAPIFTIGGGLGAALGGAASAALPALGVDPRIAALVGMAALFGGASRALLTSIVFAFETTGRPEALLPLLGGCASAYLVSCLLMRTTIMTEKIVRRGIRVPSEYVADYLDNLEVGAIALKPVVTLSGDQPLASARAWLGSHGQTASHQGYPVLDEASGLIGVVTRRDLLDPSADVDAKVRDLIVRPPVVISDDATLRDAADEMIRESIGRLPVVDRSDPSKLVGIVTRSDLLHAHSARLYEHEHRERTIKLAMDRARRSKGDLR